MELWVWVWIALERENVSHMIHDVAYYIERSEMKKEGKASQMEQNLVFMWRMKGDERVKLQSL